MADAVKVKKVCIMYKITENLLTKQKMMWDVRFNDYCRTVLPAFLAAKGVKRGETAAHGKSYSSSIEIDTLE